MGKSKWAFQIKYINDSKPFYYFYRGMYCVWRSFSIKESLQCCACHRDPSEPLRFQERAKTPKLLGCIKEKHLESYSTSDPNEFQLHLLTPHQKWSCDHNSAAAWGRAKCIVNIKWMYWSLNHASKRCAAFVPLFRLETVWKWIWEQEKLTLFGYCGTWVGQGELS